MLFLFGKAATELECSPSQLQHFQRLIDKVVKRGICTSEDSAPVRDDGRAFQEPVLQGVWSKITSRAGGSVSGWMT